MILPYTEDDVIRSTALSSYNSHIVRSSVSGLYKVTQRFWRQVLFGLVILMLILIIVCFIFRFWYVYIATNINSISEKT